MYKGFSVEDITNKLELNIMIQTYVYRIDHIFPVRNENHEITSASISNQLTNIETMYQAYHF